MNRQHKMQSYQKVLRSVVGISDPPRKLRFGKTQLKWKSNLVNRLAGTSTNDYYWNEKKAAGILFVVTLLIVKVMRL